MIPLNSNLTPLKRSPIRLYTNMARATPDCAMLTIGEPDLDTPDIIKEAAMAALRDGLREIAGELEMSTGCELRVHMNDGYPAILNPKDLFDRAMAAAPFQILCEPSMTTEDFSWYQRYLPGMFFFLGLGDTPALHTNNFHFDESILTKGADFFEKLAENVQ